MKMELIAEWLVSAKRCRRCGSLPSRARSAVNLQLHMAGKKNQPAMRSAAGESRGASCRRSSPWPVE